MKKTALATILSTAMLVAANAQAGDFDGFYIGGKVGVNKSEYTGTNTASSETDTTFNFEEGYNWEIGNFLVGGSFFADFNQKTERVNVTSRSGSNVYGLDLKLGLPSNGWMPYAKIGWARVSGSGDFPAHAIQKDDGLHLGLGLEYKLTPSWALVGELSANKGKDNGTELDNKNLMVGLNYYFGKTAAPVAAPAPAPTPAPAPAPIPVAQPEPTPAPVVVTPPPPPPPKESWKILLEEKPVTIEGANFDTASAKLRPTAEQKLGEVVEFAQTYQDATLDVQGHTDSVGKDAYNQKLSEQRAASVKSYLVKKGVAANRINTTGFGETRPIADNNTAEGRAKNRRVEIRSVIKEEKKVRVTE